MKKNRHLRGTLFDIERELRSRNAGADEAISEAFGNRTSLASKKSSASLGDAMTPMKSDESTGSVETQTSQRSIEMDERDHRGAIVRPEEIKEKMGELLRGVLRFIDEKRVDVDGIQHLSNKFHLFLTKKEINTSVKKVEEFQGLLKKVMKKNGLNHLEKNINSEIKKISARSNMFATIKLINFISHFMNNTHPEAAMEFRKKMKSIVTEYTTFLRNNSALHKALFKNGCTAFLTPNAMSIIFSYKTWGRAGDYNFLGSTQQAINTINFLRDPSLYFSEIYNSEDNFLKAYVDASAGDLTPKQKENVGNYLLPIQILEDRLGANGVWLKKEEFGLNKSGKLSFYAFKMNARTTGINTNVPSPHAISAWDDLWLPGGFTSGGTAEVAVQSYPFDQLLEKTNQTGRQLEFSKYTIEKSTTDNKYTVTETPMTDKLNAMIEQVLEVEKKKISDPSQLAAVATYSTKEFWINHE